MVINNKNRKLQNFLRHYGEGSRNILEEKPLNYTNFGRIEIYEVKFSEHNNDYDFYNPDEVVEEFLTNVRDKFQNRTVDVIAKCGFSTKNIWPNPSENSIPISDVRYWSTEPIRTKSFNDYVYFSLKKDIQKRIISKGFSASSWYFKKFNYLNLKVFSGNTCFVN